MTGCSKPVAPTISLHQAAENGDVPAIEQHIKASTPLETTNEHQLTPLHLAAVGGHLEAVQALLRGGASVEARNKLNKTAEVLAGDYGHSDVATAIHNWSKRSGRGLVDGGLGVSEAMDF
jgi:ankyrin repeat protein